MSVVTLKANFANKYEKTCPFLFDQSHFTFKRTLSRDDMRSTALSQKLSRTASLS